VEQEGEAVEPIDGALFRLSPRHGQQAFLARGCPRWKLDATVRM
jgi:hypothetical protein